MLAFEYEIQEWEVVVEDLPMQLALKRDNGHRIKYKTECESLYSALFNLVTVSTVGFVRGYLFLSVCICVCTTSIHLFAIICVFIHPCIHTIYTCVYLCACDGACVCVCVLKAEMCDGAPSSPGHSWLCLDCLSCAVLRSIQAERQTKRHTDRQTDRQTGKYTLNISINMSCNFRFGV